MRSLEALDQDDDDGGGGNSDDDGGGGGRGGAGAGRGRGGRGGVLGGGRDGDRDSDDDDDGGSCDQYHDNDMDDITLPSSLRHLHPPSSTSPSSSVMPAGDHLESGGNRLEGKMLEGKMMEERDGLEGGKIRHYERGTVRHGSVMSQVTDEDSYLSDGDSTITTTTTRKIKVTPLVLSLDS